MRAGSQYVLWKEQVLLSLTWLEAFLAGTAGAPLRREAYLVDRQFDGRFTVAVDASPWGLGGVLLDSGKAVAAFADKVSPEDRERLQVVVGDHRGQSLLEGLAILLALRIFLRWRQGEVAKVSVRSDSKAALGMALNLASPSPLMNAVGREIAYDTALGDYQVELVEHTPGVANVSPDFLSRQFSPEGDSKEVPPALQGVPLLEVPRRTQGFWRTWLAPGAPPVV
jgi:hypothetical protein